MKWNIRYLIAALAAAAPFRLNGPTAIAQTVDFSALASSAVSM